MSTDPSAATVSRLEKVASTTGSTASLAEKADGSASPAPHAAALCRRTSEKHITRWTAPSTA